METPDTGVQEPTVCRPGFQHWTSLKAETEPPVEVEVVLPLQWAPDAEPGPPPGMKKIQPPQATLVGIKIPTARWAMVGECGTPAEMKKFQPQGALEVDLGSPENP